MAVALSFSLHSYSECRKEQTTKTTSNTICFGPVAQDPGCGSSDLQTVPEDGMSYISLGRICLRFIRSKQGRIVVKDT